MLPFVKTWMNPEDMLSETSQTQTNNACRILKSQTLRTRAWWLSGARGGQKWGFVVQRLQAFSYEIKFWGSNI